MDDVLDVGRLRFKFPYEVTELRRELEALEVAMKLFGASAYYGVMLLGKAHIRFSKNLENGDRKLLSIWFHTNREDKVVNRIVVAVTLTQGGKNFSVERYEGLDRGEIIEAIQSATVIF